MKRGHSGAVVTACTNGVMKHADRGKGLLEQAALCELLAPVTPRVIAKFSTDRTESYKMELLYEPDLYPREATAWAVETLRSMRSVLAGNVWCRQVKQVAGWRTSLGHWLAAFPEVSDQLSMLLSELFNELTAEYCQTHGDPTLANVLYRANGQMVITDPIPAAGKVPHHYTVDLGKLLQSAIGWETEMFGWSFNIVAATNAVLRGYSDATKAQAWFWASIHCLRLMPYASERRVEVWALDKAQFCADQSRSYTTCSMSSILTVP